MPFTFAYAKNRLKNIDKVILSRQTKLKIYYDILNKIKGIKFIKNISYGISNTAPFSAWLILDKKYNIEKIISACFYQGIPIGKFKYDVVSEMEYFKEYSLNKDYHYKNSKQIKEQSLFLPIYENLSYKDIKKIANQFVEILELYEKDPKNEMFNIDILKTNIRYFNGFFIK